MHTTKASKPFRYLDLPAELQLRIIHFAVKGARVIDTAYADEYAIADWMKQPAMTKVSRSIRVDALSEYYKTSTFIWQICPFDQKGLRLWLKAIGPVNRQHIRDLTMKLAPTCVEDEIKSSRLAQWFDSMGATVAKEQEDAYKITFA